MVYVNHVDYKKLVRENGKRCADPECGKKGKKPASEFNIARDRHDGLQAYCKLCSRARQRASRNKEKEQKPEQYTARKKRFKEKHPEATTVYSRAYRAQKKRLRNAELRKQIELNDKMYSVPQSLHGCSLGPHIPD